VGQEVSIEHETIRSLKQFAEERGEVAESWAGPDPTIDTTLWTAQRPAGQIRPDGSWDAKREGWHMDYGPAADALIFDEEYVEEPKVEFEASDSALRNDATEIGSPALAIEVAADWSRLETAVQSARMAFANLLLRHQAVMAIVHLTCAREELRRALRDGVLPGPVIEALEDIERAAAVLQKGPE
jgi:hypothetical protein